MTQTLQAAGRPALPTDIELAGIVRQFHAARVLVIGDIILDRYVTGACQPPVAGSADPGAAAHRRPLHARRRGQRRAEHRYTGGQAILVGVIGEDPAGQQVETLVSTTLGISSALVRIAGRPTTAKTRFMTGSHQLLRLDEETTAPLDAGGSAAVLAAVHRSLPNVDVIMLSDYAKGVLCDGVLGRNPGAGASRQGDHRRPEARRTSRPIAVPTS